MPIPKFGPDVSKVKLVFMLKHNNNHLKILNDYGKLVNPVRFNYDNINKFENLIIATRMSESKAIKNMPEYKNSNCLMFYEVGVKGIHFHKINL